MAKVLAVALDKEFQRDLLRLTAVATAYALIAGLIAAGGWGALVLAYALD
jgi:hypothetical protein